MTNILLTLLASLAGGMLFLKLKVPGGVLVGGIIGTFVGYKLNRGGRK